MKLKKRRERLVKKNYLFIQFSYKNPNTSLKRNFKYLAKNQLFQQLKNLIIL